MRKTAGWMAALLLLAAFGFVGHAQPKRSLTILVYMCGSNLESEGGAASRDIEEMTAAFSADGTGLLVMTGGSSKWANGIESNQTCVTEIGAQGRRRVVDSQASRSMGDPDTLSGFIRYARDYMPAEDYALILWDHGAGPLEGLCYDELYDSDHLTLGELQMALEGAALPGKLAWIGFDACLMSSMEVASKMAPYAEYMIASEAEEPVSGWNYAFLEGIGADADGAQTGRRIVECYMEAARETAMDLTLACIRLDAMDAVERSLDDMYGAMSARLSDATFSRLSRLRLSATGFGKAAAAVTTATGFDLVDVLSLCECYGAEDPEGAQRVRQALERAVVCHGENIDGCCGMSVYHPFRNQTGFTEKWSDAYARLGVCPGYSAYIGAYGRIMSGQQMTLWNDLNDIRADYDGASSLVRLKLTQAQAANMASARMIVLARNLYDEADDAYFRVYNTEDVSLTGTLLSAWYDGKILQVVQESGDSALTGAISYRVTEDGDYQVDLYPMDEAGDLPERPIVAEYVRQGSDRLVFKDYSVYDELTEAYSRRASVDLAQYAGISFLNDYRVPTADASGEYLAFDDWDRDAHADVQWKARQDIRQTRFMLSFALEQSRAETLYAAFEIVDTQGNVYTSALTPLGQSQVEYHPLEGAKTGDEMPSLRASEGAAEWLLELKNRHDAMQYYWLYDLQIDGADATSLQWHDGEAWRAWEEGTVGVPAGETLKLRVGAGTAPGDGSGGVSGKLAVYSQDMELRFLAPFYAANGPDRDTGAAGGWLSDIMPASAEFPFSMRYSLIVKPAEYAEDAELIINAAMTNEGDAPLAFSVAQVSLNGASLEGWFDSQEGAGPSAAPGAIAPGETRAANIILNRADLSGLSQDVSIRKIDFMIYVRSPIPGNAEDFLVVGAWPVSLAAEIPLTAFASETTALPSRQLLPSDPGEADGRVLFSNGDCDVTLEGLFVVRGTPVLLLRCANGSERAWTVYLGQATLNGREADIGRTGNVLVSSRNNRVRAFELDRERWKLPRGAVFRVEPGQARSLFVSVSPPEGGTMEKLEALTMRAYMVEAGEDAQDSEYVLFDAAGLRLPDGIDLDPAGECRVDPGALEVAQGRPLAPDARPDILSDEVWTPEASVSDGMRLSFELPEGETMQTAKYLLMRRVRSAAELADMSILSGTNEKTRNAEISFAGQTEWMIFEASGEMRVSEDGRSAFADYPALRAAARFSDGSIPLAITEIRREEDGSITFEQDVSNFLVMSSAFPGAGVDYMLNQIRLRYDPQTHEAGIASANEEWHGNTYSGLADCAQFGYLLLFPADATLGELAQYVCGEGPNGQYQFQVHALEDHRLQLAIEPVDDPENYCVVFWHYSPKTGVQCTAPRPLDAFTG